MIASRQPLLLIETPPSYANERSYAVCTVFCEFLGMRVVLRQREDALHTRITLCGDDSRRELAIPEALFATCRKDWLTTLSLPEEPLRWLPGAESGANPSLPMIYRHEPNRTTSEPAVAAYSGDCGSSATLPFDLLGSVFFALTRYEEVCKSTLRDWHGRFPARESLAYREGFLGRPVVDEYVQLLWSVMKRLWPRLERAETDYRVVPTHDVDVLSSAAGLPWRTVIRQAGGDVLRRRSASSGLKRLRWRSTGSNAGDPVNNYDFIMDASDQFGLTSEFYFMTGDGRMPLDGAYSIESGLALQTLRRIHERGHLVGLHTSYSAWNSAHQTRREFVKLMTVVDRLGIEQREWGGRQHYLRWTNPLTWRCWAEAGLKYDSSVSYADHAGFRCGTARSFPVFDLLRREQLALIERPLIVMDGSLLDPLYMGLARDQAAETVDRLARQCRRVGGNMVLLWHNTSLGDSSSQQFYSSLLERIA